MPRFPQSLEFPRRRKILRALPREMADAEYILSLAAATGRSPETVAEILQKRKEVRANA
jgi:hypothetical protein